MQKVNVRLTAHTHNVHSTYLRARIVDLFEILCDCVVHDGIIVAQVVERQRHVDALLAIQFRHAHLQTARATMSAEGMKRTLRVSPRLQLPNREDFDTSIGSARVTAIAFF